MPPSFRYSENHVGMEVTVFLRHVKIGELSYQKPEILRDTIPRTSHLEDVMIDVTLQRGSCYAGTMEVWGETFITNSIEQSSS
jgi:hypothetical protein